VEIGKFPTIVSRKRTLTSFYILVIMMRPRLRSLGRTLVIPNFPTDRRERELINRRGSPGEVKIGENIMKYAIIEDGGKQYRAVEGGTLEVDRYDAEPGDQIDLDRVLLVADGEDVVFGAPLIEGAKIEATVLEQVKGPKIVVFKYKPKIRYRVKKGHRQQYTRLIVNSIVLDTGGKNGA
jgi:large subunit ribosomal protein L21